MAVKELTAEEKKFFETGETKGLPDDYAGDVKTRIDDETDVDEQAKPVNTENEAVEPNADSAQQGDQPDQNQQVGDDGKKPSVPLATHLEERRKRQETERTLQELQRQQAVVNDRLAAIYAAQEARNAKDAQPKTEEPEIPDPEADPIAAIRWAQQQQIERQKHEREYAQRTEQERYQHNQRVEYENRVINTAKQVYSEYSTVDPDFSDQRQYVLYGHVQDLMSQGATEEQALQKAKLDEFALCSEAFQRGSNPAEIIKGMAQRRGYRKGWATPVDQNENKSDNAAAKLDQVARGQQASASPSTGGTSGNARSGKLDAKSLAEMSDKEFKEFLAKDQDGEGWRKVMGA